MHVKNLRSAALTQSAMLPCHPLFANRLIERIFKPEPVLRIVLPRQVCEDGKAFHDGEAALVVINNDRNAAIGAEFGEPFLLLYILTNIDALENVFFAICLL
jgi:hypothetical protein